MSTVSDNDKLTTLVELLQRYSPSGEEANAVEYLVNRMNELGYTRSYIDSAGNAVGEKGDGDRQIVLLGHIDTVPGFIPVVKEGNILFGRGSVDAKGPLSAFTDAVAQVDAIPGWKIIVIGAVEEERESKGACSILSSYLPEFAIIGEPNLWNRIAIGYKGSAHALISVHSKKFHSARLEKNAFSRALDGWNEVLKWTSEYNSAQQKLFHQIQVYITSWSANDDGFYENAIIQIAARLPPGIPSSEWYIKLRELMPDIDLTPLGNPIEAYQSSKNTSLVKAFLSSIRANSGNPEFVLKSGTADYNIVGPVWNCPIVVYGPGDSQYDHTPDEQIDINEYYLSIEVLKGVLRTLTR